MSKIFYIAELIQFAIEKEQESYSFYKSLAENKNITNKKIITLFNELMTEEQNHKTYYTKLLEAVKKEQSTGVSYGEEYNEYMRELILSSRSDSDIDLNKIMDNKNINQIIDYAVKREKDSIAFYVGLKNYVPKNSSEKVDTIIQEEAKHVVKLLQLKHSF